VSSGSSVRPAAAALLLGGAAVVGVPTPSEAAPCPGSAGVSVFVEYGALGGGTALSCVPEGGGRTADRLLKGSGHELDYVQRFPGFVCRIDGVPGDDPCVNTPPSDAYWGLWWSDGESGRWTYSSLGAGSLTIPAGGYVAMVWDDSAGAVRPRTGAPAHPTPTPSPSPTATKPPSPDPTPAPTGSATPTAPATAQPTAQPSRTKKPSKTPSPSDAPTTTEPTSASSAASPSDEKTEAGGVIQDPVHPAAATADEGLPGWVAPVLVVVLLGAAGAVAVVRRRHQ
jgi:hypothetical protein